MRSRISLLVGLSTVLLLLSIHTISYANGQSPPLINETSNANSELQTENSDPFKATGSDGSTSNNEPDDNKEPDDSKSSEDDKDSKSSDDDKKYELPFP